MNPDRYGYIGIEALLDFCVNSKDNAITPNDFMRMPRAKEPEQKEGRWLRRADNPRYLQYYRCSRCGGDNDGRSSYCPHCGAEMRKKDNEEIQ